MFFTLLNININTNTHVTLPSSNLGYAHSGEGTSGLDAHYGDKSGMMGFSYFKDEGPVMVRKDVIIL